MRRRSAYAFKSMIDAGIRLAFGTDFPVATANPLTSIHAAVTRQTPVGFPDGGYLPEQRIDLATALRAASFNGAVMAGRDTVQGRIAPGQRADLVILDSDITRAPHSDILNAQVTRTLLGGETLYSS